MTKLGIRAYTRDLALEVDLAVGAILDGMYRAAAAPITVLADRRTTTGAPTLTPVTEDAA